MNLKSQNCVFVVESGKFLRFIVNHRGDRSHSSEAKSIDLDEINTNHQSGSVSYWETCSLNNLYQGHQINSRSSLRL